VCRRLPGPIPWVNQMVPTWKSEMAEGASSNYTNTLGGPGTAGQSGHPLKESLLFLGQGLLDWAYASFAVNMGQGFVCPQHKGAGVSGVGDC
jgi:hypothetical protein